MAMGQTLAAEKGSGTKMTVCSPRYPTYHRENFVPNNGMCFVMEEPTSVTSISPPKNEVFVNSLSGFSAASIENNLVVGAPTGTFGCGSVTNYVPGNFPYMNRFTEKSNNKEEKNKAKACSSNYEGWAVQVGRFADSSSPLTIAASTPKANNYKGQGSRSHQPEQVLLGRHNMGRFGTSVASLGDINGDTYHDVAIGAPYAGEDGSGLVYIYNGGRDGLVHANPKVIASSKFLPGARGFGFSLDGDLDMDDNGYPDMVIGAVHSNSAVLLRASPVLRLIGSVTFNPSPIDIKTKVCEIEQPGQKIMRGVCFDVKVDLQYTSKATFSNLKLEYELKMSIVSNSSMKYGFKHNTDRTTREVRKIYKDRSTPWSLTIFVQRSRDNLDLDVSVTVAVVRVAAFEPFGLPPILDTLTPTSFSNSSQLVCEDESGCSTEPDLVLNAFGSPVIMVDVPVRIHLNVSVEVRRDPAYGIKVNVNYPDHITYKDVDARGIIPQCRMTMVGRSEIECNLDEGNADEQIDFWLTFEHSKEEEEDLLLQGTTFSLSVSNDERNSDPDPSNNHARVTIPTITKATLYSQYISEPEVTVVVVNETASQEEIEAARTAAATFPIDRLGPRFDHRFFLNNRGPSPVQDAMLLFDIPLYLGEAPLTYFMSQPVTSPGVTCDPVPINPLGLQPPRQPVTASDSAITSFTKEITTTQQWRAKREAKESTSATTSRSTSVDDSTFPYDSSTYSSTFHWTTDPAEYFSSTYGSIQSKQTENDNVLKCKEPECLKCTKPVCLVKCHVKRIPARDSVEVSFSSYLVTATLDKLGLRKVLVRTSLTPNVTQKGSLVINPMANAIIEVHLEKPLNKNFFSLLPLWQILLAVALAVFFILIITFIMWKIGFFRRKRPQAEYTAQTFHQEEKTIDSCISETQ
ncbi:integrin alpha-6-like isoform X2 [Portunus trituberculatus]|uniref:integrin alpha-6-like isoform X2 n=1 Tax=Portunus trituberculatus TaxID=210409 RepID=UPI001E1D1545|nr:integrin alpha-6-like isoform X2 [Portunus trituberculatus]